MCNLEYGLNRPETALHELELLALVKYEKEVEDRNLGFIVGVEEIGYEYSELGCC